MASSSRTGSGFFGLRISVSMNSTGISFLAAARASAASLRRVVSALRPFGRPEFGRGPPAFGRAPPQPFPLAAPSAFDLPAILLELCAGYSSKSRSGDSPLKTQMRHGVVFACFKTSPSGEPRNEVPSSR